MPDREAVRLATEQAARDGLQFCAYDAWVKRTIAMLGLAGR